MSKGKTRQGCAGGAACFESLFPTYGKVVCWFCGTSYSYEAGKPSHLGSGGWFFEICFLLFGEEDFVPGGIRLLREVFFSAYGTPTCVVTDNAKVFCCKQFRDLCLRWGITHVTTTPYYPQASLSERVNRNLKSALKIFHHASQSAWDEDLPWLSLVLIRPSMRVRSVPLINYFGKGIKVSLISPMGFIPCNYGWYWGGRSVVLDKSL